MLLIGIPGGTHDSLYSTGLILMIILFLVTLIPSGHRFPTPGSIESFCSSGLIGKEASLIMSHKMKDTQSIMYFYIIYISTCHVIEGSNH